MAKVCLFIALILLSICAQAGVIYLHNSTHRSLLIVYQICYDETHCGGRNQLILAPNTQLTVDITPNNYFSILSAVSDGPDIDAWKGNWGAGFRTGQCTAQPASTTAVLGNKITLHNFGGSPQLICTVSPK